MHTAFVRTFKHNHSDHEIHAGSKFNIIVLETLLMVDMLERIDDASPNNSSAPADIFHVVQSSRSDLIMTLQARRSWLELRHKDCPDHRSATTNGSSGLDVNEEMEIYASWDEFGPMVNTGTADTLSVLFFGILHRLMTLLARIAPEVGYPNGKLKNLACQAMLQAALSSLGNVAGDDDTPTLAACFAYGYVDGLAQTSEHLSSAEFDVLDNEHQIIELFQQPDHSGGLIPLEHSDWTEARRECLSLFRIPASTQELGRANHEARLRRLRHQHPYEAFEEQLLACLGHLWMLNCGAVTGTPVLVHIEQGHLDGLDDLGFEDFMRRVGLRKDSEGILKMVKL